jgi:hypothetical protein
VARTDTLNAANLANEVGTVFPTANTGHRPGLLAVKDAGVEASARAVIATGVVGHLDVVVDGSLASGGWEARDRVKARTPEQMLNDARAGNTDRYAMTSLGAGTPSPYGGQHQ